MLPHPLLSGAGQPASHLAPAGGCGGSSPNLPVPPPPHLRGEAEGGPCRGPAVQPRRHVWKLPGRWQALGNSELSPSSAPR